MAQTSKPKQGQPKPRDAYVQRSKELTSAAQRLRGWVGSDPSKEPELADALVALNAHRLLGHSFAVAAADAQEAARRAATLLTANGPIGPYTDVADAVRYVGAVVHLATIQIALGLPEAAGRALDGLTELRGQLAGLDERIDPTAAIWALTAQARVALAADDIPAANAYADAALDRLAESGQRRDPDATYLILDVERVAADARWLAGRADESLAHLHAAKDDYDRLVDGRLEQPGRLSPALLERLAEPLFGLYRDLADRLIATGEGELGLVIRRDQVDRLRPVAAKLPDPTSGQLTAAEGDLAADLRAAGRNEEAEAIGAASDRERVALGAPASWSALDPVAAYAAVTAGSAGAEDEASLEAERERETAEWLAGQRAEAHRLEEERLAQARLAADEREAERRAAEQAEAERRAAESARLAEEARVEAERQAAAEEAEHAERKRRREERMVAYRLEQERLEAERRAAEADEAEDLDADETERREERRLQAERERAAAEAEAAEEAAAAQAEADRREAERADLERAEDERQAAARADAERAEAERLATEQAEADRREAEDAEAERSRPAPEPEVPSRPDPVAEAEHALRDARTAGERKTVRAALDRLADVLRPQAEADRAAHGPRLVEVLDELASSRLRGGDIFGSRAAAREAKALSRAIGRE